MKRRWTPPTHLAQASVVSSSKQHKKVPELIVQVADLLLKALIPAVLGVATCVINDNNYAQQRLDDAHRKRLEASRLYVSLLPHLKSTEPRERQIAFEIASAVDKEFAIKLAEATRDKESLQALRKIRERAARIDRARIDELILTIEDEKRISSFVEHLERGKVTQAYDEAVVDKLFGDISYGRWFFTLRTGRLSKLIGSYVNLPATMHGSQLRRYLPKLDKKSPELLEDNEFIQLLKQAGTDPMMQSLQESRFKVEFFEPALERCKELGLRYHLSIAIILSDLVQLGSVAPRIIENRVKSPRPRDGGDEKKWISDYLDQAEILAADSRFRYGRQLMIVRIKYFRAFVQSDNWELK